MKPRLSLLFADAGGNAAVEMALVLPLLLVLMFSAAEAGNYVMNEHGLVKAVRDGARFAARQNFSNYTGCSGSPGGTVVADTQNVVIHGLRSGGSKYLVPNIAPGDITVSMGCGPSVGGQDMHGIYDVLPLNQHGQKVIVSASVVYRPLTGAFGLTGAGLKLNAASQAAVTGL